VCGRADEIIDTGKGEFSGQNQKNEKEGRS